MIAFNLQTHVFLSNNEIERKIVIDIANNDSIRAYTYNIKIDHY